MLADGTVATAAGDVSTGNAAKDFVETRGHRRFVHFCETVARYRCIGVCVGVAGVGKTTSARRYSSWDVIEPLFPRYAYTQKPPAELALLGSVFYRPEVVGSPRKIAADIQQRRNLMDWLIDSASEELTDDVESAGGHERSGPGSPAASRALPARGPLSGGLFPGEASYTRLVIVDEANWLGKKEFEQLRSIFDGGDFGMVLMGMVGLEKSLARYAQLYSRIGFVHRYGALTTRETMDLARNHAAKLGVGLGPEAFADEDGVAALVRECRNNLRLLEKLLQQSEQIMELNELSVLSAEVVDTARESLTIGAD